MWIGALMATVAVFRFIAAPSAPPLGPDPVPAPVAIADAAPTASTALAAEPTPTPSLSPSPTVIPSSTSERSDRGVASMPIPKVAPAETAAAKAPDGLRPTTAALRCPQRSYGHRVYVDGHIVGEGGPHDLIVPCGLHRVRIGSNGVDKTTTIPCGGTLEL
jgi:hypothetical protein